MRFLCVILLCLQGWLYTVQTDFDVAVVGTSPISMLEAIYHSHLGNKVLILEADARCGGAWKSIDICGVSHADLGCHQLGSAKPLKEFFEQCFGCAFVCMEHCVKEGALCHSRCQNGYYFSGGCHALISKLEAAIRARSNALLLHQKLESVSIDQDRGYVELHLSAGHFSTGKLIITSASSFQVENSPSAVREVAARQFYHLYMLIQDGKPACFTHSSQIAPGMTRAMNLTPFLEMPQPDQQLIVIQTQKKREEADALRFLDAFKSKGLLTQQAQILATEDYTYHQNNMSFTRLLELGGPMIELLDTSSFAGMSRYLEKWKKAIPPH